MLGNDYKEEDFPVTDFIDVSDYAEKTVNNVNFVKLLREYLLQHRIYANKFLPLFSINRSIHFVELF
jgi:hypothetical protein